MASKKKSRRVFCFREIRESAEQIAKDYHMDVDDIEVEVSVDPKDEAAEDGIRYFGIPHEAMMNQGTIMICSEGIRNIPRKTTNPRER